MLRYLKRICPAIIFIIWVSFPFCTGKRSSVQECFLVIRTDSIPPSAIDAVSKVLLDSLGIKVQVISGPALPDSLWSSGRKRYRSASLLQWMGERSGLYSVEYQLLVTDKDLGVDYGGEYLKGANGLSIQGGKYAVISDYRLHQFGRSRDSVDYYLGKVALHETGHLLGLNHCKMPHCIMESVEVKQHITSIGGFCVDCRKKIFHRCE